MNLSSFRHVIVAIVALTLSATAFSQSFENDRIYNAYLKIQDATVAGQFEEALVGINKLAGYKTADIETAAILRARGFILLNLKREEDAINDFQVALDLGVLNNVMQQEMRYLITNLLAAKEEWQPAYEMYKTWLEISTSPKGQSEDLPQPDADGYQLGAAIASNCDDYAFALECTEKAIDLNSKPDRDLYNLLIALNFQAKDLKQAVAALKRALAHFPDDEEFWRNLSGIYQMIKEDKEALAALVIAYEEGLMTSKEEFLLLGRFYLFNKMPFNGAMVLSTGIENGTIPKEPDTLELLSQAWFAAREYDNSLSTLIEIVRETGDEEASLRASQILIDKEEYEQAIELLELCQQNEKIEDPGMLYKLKGYALFGTKDYAEAIQAFDKAAQSDPELTETVTQWVDYLKTEFIAQAE
ncbi:tetratricopeptide repeat domain protein [Verrucomicrobiia bacterium DG1235]|nr:tetratricopeptide repeat domain protein [Verrucomicrobiae bacterium DG1235]